MTTGPRARGGPTIALILLLALAAGACGGDDDTASGTTTTTAPAPTTAVAPATTTVEMRPHARASGPSAGCTSPDPAFAASTTEGTFEHDGVDRAYNLTVPPGAGAEPAALVVNLHGANGTDDGQDSASRMPALAAEEGFVVLSPQATEPGRVWRIQPGGIDTTYVLALLDAVEEGMCIDRARVHIAGFSMGAMLATTLSCLQPGRFAAVGAVSGLADLPACQDPADRRSPLIAFHGAGDDVVMADGSYSGTVRIATGLSAGPSREALAAEWAGDLGCDREPTVTEDPPVTSTVFTCPGGAGVEFHLVARSDHHWPGGNPGYSDPVAPPGEPSATDLMWDFFERQPT